MSYYKYSILCPSIVRIISLVLVPKFRSITFLLNFELSKNYIKFNYIYIFLVSNAD
jgi:hypothetical protein